VGNRTSPNGKEGVMDKRFIAAKRAGRGIHGEGGTILDEGVD